MAEQVRRYEGTVAQLVGDEMLAFFGAPVSHEDDSERAVRAALAIQRAVQSYAQEVKDAYGIELAVRIGINTGPVVVGMEADGDGDPWNALGDTVNVAARLQNIAPEGGIVVGPTTERQIEDCFEVEELETPELKGISKKLRIYKIVGSREMEHPEPAHAIVGRDFELSVLERVMEGLVEGRGAIVSVMGEPGIGKSRLVWEVRSRYRDRVRFIEGRSVSYAQTFPYWPIRDLLREWLGVGASTPEARVRLELKAQLAELFGEESEEVYPFFANLLNLTLEPDAAQRIRELNRESIQTATFEAFYEFICKLAEEQPIGLVFEDLHWADESTLELIESLLGVTEESSVALFLLYRTEREHGVWSLGERARQRYPHRTREVEVRPLPADASRSLATLSAEGELPETVTDHLAQRSGGNPFFLEEALRDLVERGALVKRERQVGDGRDRGRARDPGARSGRAAGPSRPARAADAGGALVRSSHRKDVRASAPREARAARAAPAGAHRAAAARPDRGGAPPPESRVPLPPRARPGGRLREPRRDDAQEAPQARRRGAGGDLPRVAGGELRAARPPLQRGGRARQGRRLPPEGRRPGTLDLRRPGGARALPEGAHLPRPGRRRGARPRHPLQDGAHLPPRLRLRERGGDVRRGVLLPRRRGDAATSRPSTSRPRSRSPTPSSPATSTRRRA